MTKTSGMQVPAVRFVQRGRVFYTTAIPAGRLIHLGRVDVFDADTDPDVAGYQRAPSTTRLRDMANFIERDDSILPVGGLLNARAAEQGEYGTQLTFVPLGPDVRQDAEISVGMLTLPDDSGSLYIVDMQHRILGIQRAIQEDERGDLEQFPVVCTIADGLSRHEEVEQFELINTTQKKVATDLARRLLSMQLADADSAVRIDERGKRWEARGPKIVEWLTANSEIWEGRIIPPNKSKRQLPLAITKETSFVTSLKPILESPAFQRMTDETVGELLDRYWQAVRLIWPAPFIEPKDHVIHNTSGIFPLHRVMPEVFEYARVAGQPPTTERMADAMRGWALHLGPDFWLKKEDVDGAARYGTSMAAFSRIASLLRKHLPDLELRF